MSNGKAMIIHLIVGLIRKKLYKMSQYFAKSYRTYGRDINVKVDSSQFVDYATKTYFKNATGVDTFGLALKPNLAKLKTEVDKIDIDKLETVPVDLANLTMQ